MSFPSRREIIMSLNILNCDGRGLNDSFELAYFFDFVSILWKELMVVMEVKVVIG